jgi:MFS transporter, NNP family, nitrate/nitrite transporter
MTIPTGITRPQPTSAQQNRALTLSTLSFTVCFAVWTIFAIIGVQIKKDLGLTDFEFGLLAGTPILRRVFRRNDGTK